MTSTTLKGVHSTSSLPPTLPPTHTLTLPHSYPPSLFPSLPPSSPLTLPPSYPPSLPSFSQLLTPSQPIRYHAMPCHAVPCLYCKSQHKRRSLFFIWTFRYKSIKPFSAIPCDMAACSFVVPSFNIFTFVGWLECLDLKRCASVASDQEMKWDRRRCTVTEDNYNDFSDLSVAIKLTERKSIVTHLMHTDRWDRGR